MKLAHDTNIGATVYKPARGNINHANPYVGGAVAAKTTDMWGSVQMGNTLMSGCHCMSGCHSDIARCVFAACKVVNTTGYGTYELINKRAPDEKGAEQD
jgi:hypothetical protein